MDFLEDKQIDLAVVQEKNYQLFITELEIILNDIKQFADKKELLKINILFKMVKQKENEAQGFLDFKRNIDGQTEYYQLKQEFYNVMPILSDLRGLVLKSLLDFINPNFQQSKEGGLR